MKRVFAHIGFTTALTLFILNLFNVQFAYILFVLLLGAFFISLAVKKIRQAVSVCLCIGSAAFACLIFIFGINGSYAPQLQLDGETCNASFYVTDCSESDYSYFYDVKTLSIDAPGVPQNINLSVRTEKPIDFEYGEVLEGTLSFEKVADNGYDSFGKFADKIFLQADALSVETTGEIKGGLIPLSLRLRDNITNVLTSALRGDNGGLALALITGDKQYIYERTVSDFYDCGATHLMAVSGLHLAVVVGSIYFLLRKLYVPVLPRTVIAVAVMLIYDGVAGFSSSMMRSSIMMLVLLCGRLFKRKSDGVNSLGLAVFILCLNPFAITDVSLLLSAGSVLALQTLAPVMYSKIAGHIRFGKRIAKSLCSSFSVLVYTLPILWFTYGKAVLLSIVSNLFLIPVAEFTILSTMLLLVFSRLGFIGYFFACLSGFGTELLMKITSFLSSNASVSIYLSPVYSGIGIAIVFLIFGAVFVCRYTNALKTAAFMAVAAFAVTVTLGAYSEKDITYVCAGENAVMIYDSDRAVIAGNMGSSEYYHFKKEIENRSLKLELVACEDTDFTYYNILITNSCPTEYFIADELDDSDAAQVNAVSIIEKEQFSVDLSATNHVSYSRNKKSYALTVETDGMTICVGTGVSLSACDLAVTYKRSSSYSASKVIVCPEMEEGELVTASLKPGCEISVRRENKWLS